VGRGNLESQGARWPYDGGQICVNRCRRGVTLSGRKDRGGEAGSRRTGRCQVLEAPWTDGQAATHSAAAGDRFPTDHLGPTPDGAGKMLAVVGHGSLKELGPKRRGPAADRSTGEMAVPGGGFRRRRWAGGSCAKRADRQRVNDIDDSGSAGTTRFTTTVLLRRHPREHRAGTPRTTPYQPESRRAGLEMCGTCQETVFPISPGCRGRAHRTRWNRQQR